MTTQNDAPCQSDQPYLLEATQDPTGWWRCVARGLVVEAPERRRLVVIAAGEGDTMEAAIVACEREIAREQAEHDARLWPE